MDKIGKYTLSYLAAYLGLLIVLAVFAASIEGGHPSPAVYVVYFMGALAGVSMPVVIYYSVAGINKAITASPRYSAWKCVVSLLVSLLILVYFVRWFISA